jgi:hypothetical protein
MSISIYKPDQEIELITDISLPSYVVIGRLYKLTLESLGLTVNERSSKMVKN